jgi:predicted PurR-regulated permease PerM
MRIARPFGAPQNEATVPYGVAVATAWSRRFLVIIAALTVAVFMVFQLSFIVIPLLIAVLITALVAPLAQFLRRHRWPGWLATLTTLLALISAVTGLFWLVVLEIIRDWPSLQRRTLIAYENFVDFLIQSRHVGLECGDLAYGHARSAAG